MAEEEQKTSSSKRSNRRRKRRNSRRRKQKSSTSSGETAPNAQPKPNAQQEQPKKNRRRRRRSRSRGKPTNQQQNNAPKDAIDAQLPDNVFVYTHVVHSSTLDTYGFRPDPFMNSTRGLNDFRIDLSAIFPDQENNTGADVPIYDSALHSPINARLSSDEASDEHSDHDSSEPSTLDATTVDTSHNDELYHDFEEEKPEWLEEVQKAVDERVDDQSGKSSDRP